MTYNDLRKGRHSQVGLVYHITAVTLNRIPFFSTLVNGRKLVLELMALQQRGEVETLCYVIMPDHFHWLMRLQKGTLSAVVGQLKARTARAIGQAVWQSNFFDRALRSDEDLSRIARYIVANPLRSKLVARMEEYSLWDAVWLEETLSG
jgi:REP element-mobilizing transposase RayT